MVAVILIESVIRGQNEMSTGVQMPLPTFH